MSYSGGCLCGNIRFTVSHEPMMPGHCQCTKCRKLSGSGHASMFAVPKSAIDINKDKLKFFDFVADSGNTVKRGFCPECGSPVYNENVGIPDMGFLHASSLDDPEIFKPGMVIYTSEALSWDYVDSSLPGVPKMPDMSGMAK